MAQLTIRLDDALAERIKNYARRHGQSMNQFALTTMTAAVDPDNEDSEVARARAKLAAAGLLVTPTPRHATRPSDAEIAAAQASAGVGTPLSDLISEGRG